MFLILGPKLNTKLLNHRLWAVLPCRRQDPFGILYFSPFPRRTGATPGRRRARGGQRGETSPGRRENNNNSDDTDDTVIAALPARGLSRHFVSIQFLAREEEEGWMGWMGGWWRGGQGEEGPWRGARARGWNSPPPPAPNTEHTRGCLIQWRSPHKTVPIFSGVSKTLKVGKRQQWKTVKMLLSLFFDSSN